VAGADHPRTIDLELAHADVPVVVRRDAGRIARVGRFVRLGPMKRISAALPRETFSPM
jgi:hypothetical protein